MTDRLHGLIDDGGSIFDIVLFRKPDQVAPRPEVPHRQFVFTIPRILRGIFRKRSQLLSHLFHTATETFRGAFRTRLALPDGKLGAIAAALLHLPPKGQQMVRYYGLYSK